LSLSKIAAIETRAGKYAPVEDGAPEICATYVGVFEVTVLRLDAREGAAHYYGIPKIGGSEHGPRVGDGGAKIGVAKVCGFQIGIVKTSQVEDRSAQIRRAKLRPTKICSFECLPGKIRLPHIGAAEV
jgi:hypothetical protein